MTDSATPDERGWFAGQAQSDGSESAAIQEGQAKSPEEWPARAVEAGFADSEQEYYDRLHEVTVEAARAEARERQQADDQQIIHAVRAIDDCERMANELAERVTEWARSLTEEAPTGIEGSRAVADREPASPAEARLVTLAQRVVALDEEATRLRQYVEETMPTVAPNLSSIAGPVLAARLLALAGGLESLAKQPSGTVQVLGAEDALFAHLQGGAPSPKHGVIYTHEYVHNTPEQHRGSAARALAGKLSIAARIDHYSGDRRPNLAGDLDERIETIRARDSS
jgi:nucleolar protein 56